MQRREPPILGFRRRLLRLIDEQFEGKYTVFAQRAGIPVSSMQHVMHTAKHLPGGEHLQKMARALGVTAQYLSTGDEAVLPIDRPTPPSPPVRPRRVLPGRGDATHVTIPLCACACPGPWPLTAAVPPMAAARARVVVSADLVGRHQTHRQIALQVSPSLPCAEWPVGAQLVVDWDACTPAWAALQLIQSDGQCRLGHVTPAGDRLLFAPRLGGMPELVAREGRVRGTVIAAVTLSRAAYSEPLRATHGEPAKPATGSLAVANAPFLIVLPGRRAPPVDSELLFGLLGPITGPGDLHEVRPVGQAVERRRSE
jgi:hypothetical protein